MSNDLQRAVGQLEGTVGALGQTVNSMNGKLDTVLAHIAAQNAVNEKQKDAHVRHTTIVGAIAGAVAGAVIKLGTSLFGIHS